MAKMTLSASMIFVVSSSNFGANLPFSSKTDNTRTSSIPVTLPFSPRIRLGPQDGCSSICSSIISSTSCCPVREILAGISSKLSRQAIWIAWSLVNSLGPPVVRFSSIRPRRTSRAASRATRPPPITTVLVPSCGRLPRFASSRNSTAIDTPSKSAPSMGNPLPFIQPAPINTESKPWSNKLWMDSTLVLVRISTPWSSITWISLSRTSAGRR